MSRARVFDHAARALTSRDLIPAGEVNHADPARAYYAREVAAGRAPPKWSWMPNAQSGGGGRVSPGSVQKSMRDVKAEYAAGVASKYRRTRGYLGGLADAHYTNTYQFWSIREYVRDMERNDPLIGPAFDQSENNVLGCGLRLHPETKDANVNAYLLDRWTRWANDKMQCDASKRFTFSQLERLVYRAELIDGDIFALPLSDGTIQVIEGDHVDSPQKLGGDIIHGVRISDTHAPLEYWFTKDREWVRFAHVLFYATVDGYDKRPAFDENGDPVVLHVYNPKRYTQSRGISALHAIFDYMGMLEDANFACLVKQQMASALFAFLERTQDFSLGSRTQEAQADGTSRTIEEMAPGTMIRGFPGEKLTAFNPNIPGTDYHEHVRFLLRVFGIQLGLPLELVTLDFSEGNFSSQRLAIQQARIGFGVQQDQFPRRFNAPIFRWKAREWLAEYPGGALDARAHPELLDHAWTGEGWPYIDPLTDVQADKMRVDNGFISPRRLAAEHGMNHADVVRETLEDRKTLISEAIKIAEELSTDDRVIDWREVANLAPPAGMTITKTTSESLDDPAATPGGNSTAKKDAPKKS